MKISEFNVDKPVKFISAGHFISSGEWIHPTRRIDTYVLIIGQNGTAYISENGEEYILNAGDTLLLSPNTEHGGYKKSENVSYYWFHFKLNDSAENTFEEYTDNLTFQNEHSLILPKFYESLRQDKLFILANQLLDIYESKYSNIYAGDYLMTSILIELSEQFYKNISHTLSDDSRNIYRICEWIRVNCQNKITLENVAEQFSYNKNYLCRIFKKHTGTTVQKYINRLKISLVKQYLCSTDKTVQEIAYIAGFDDEKYMMRLFKEFEMMTPGQFRNAYGKTHINSK